MPSSSAPTLWGGDLEVATLQVHDPRGGGVLSADERQALLGRVRAGEPMSLQFTARTFVQRATPNRNYLRIAPKSLTALNRSFNGVPFLRDHDQHSIGSRGGTVMSSALERTDDGAAFVQLISLSKPWAVEGVLDGTIDRFSVGFHPTGPVFCSVHLRPVFTECSCAPGQHVSKDSDERVEFILSAADGVEVSAVNVPAVLGTGVEDIRAALAAFTWLAPERKPMSKLTTRLQLADGATEDDMVAVCDRWALERAADQERIRLLEARNAEFEIEQARTQALALDADIEQLYQTGRLPMTRDASGKRIPHAALETPIREMARTLGYAAFKAYVERMPASFGPGPMQSTPAAAAATNGPSARPIDQAAQRLNLDPTLMRETLEQMGLTDETVAKFGPRQGV
jgi:phage head maturation protease